MKDGLPAVGTAGAALRAEFVFSYRAALRMKGLPFCAREKGI